jgi:hypothetical protein
VGGIQDGDAQLTFEMTQNAWKMGGRPNGAAGRRRREFNQGPIGFNERIVHPCKAGDWQVAGE